jgi:sialic acid synthase SpsE
MSIITLANERKIGLGYPTYIIAELNTSHFGDLNLAKRMIDGAKEAGADCVKFQSWSESSLYSQEFYNQNRLAQKFIQKFALKENDLVDLNEYAKSMGIDFASTPYSESEADFLTEVCEVPFIKVASMDLNNLCYLEYLSKKTTPIFLSTGMGTMDEIVLAIDVLSKHGFHEIGILHCVSLYPTNDSILNLRNVKGIRDTLPGYVVGFSDHSIGNLASLASVVLGASIVEKHVTLDATKIGMDNQMAMEIKDFSKLVSQIRKVEEMLGTEERIVSKLEVSKSLEMRRSVVAAVDLKVGDVLTQEKLTLKRPGSGIPAHRISEVLGLVVNEEICAGTLLKFSHINSEDVSGKSF